MSAFDFTPQPRQSRRPVFDDGAVDPARALDALQYIPSDLPREDWVKAAMAAKAAGLTFDDFASWSSTADSYKATDARDTWKSLKGSGVGPGTLFMLAKQHGWQDTRRSAKRPAAAPRPQEKKAAAGESATALAVWNRLTPAQADHPYIMAKGGRAEGLRMVPADDPLTVNGQRMAGRLAVPVMTANGLIQSIQLLPAPGQGPKLNLAGCTLTGGRYVIGTQGQDDPIYLVEGIGQAWACNQATGRAAIVCFGWNNVGNVARDYQRVVIVPDAGKEGKAQEIAREIGGRVAYLPQGESSNFDCNDFLLRDGLDALRSILDSATRPAPDRSRPPPPADLIPTEDELAAASLTPRCIVRDHSYASVAQYIAPGGTGKTTLLVYESLHVALGWPLYGLEVESPGWTLFITAEDNRGEIMARMREIMATLDLAPEERSTALRGVRVWDVTGEPVKLIRVSEGNIILTNLADEIVEAYKDDPPAIVVFDPLVSFGASEGMVNDNEQGLILAARRIVKGLDCCVRFIHHTGVMNARTGALDQYAGRGGSALPDGTRMTSVLQKWTPEGRDNRQPPAGCTHGPGVTITILSRPKLSYSPDQPLIWIRREGFAFEYFYEAPPQAPEVIRAAKADQIERFIVAQLELDPPRRYSPRSLEAMADTVNMTRSQVRAAIEELRVSGRIVDAPLPKDQCQGSRKTYLSIASNCAEDFGAVQADDIEK